MAHELNLGTINGLSMDEIITMMKSKGIGESSGSGSGSGGATDKYTDIIDGVIALGSTVTMGGHQWVVCHIDYDGKIFYLLDAIVESTTKFGSTSNYPGSTLAGVAASFESNLPSNVLSKLLTVNVSGVSAKVFVPNLTQYRGGLNLFTSDSVDKNRIGYYNGVTNRVWTSSPSNGGYVTYVDTDGSFYNNGNIGNSCGFRPCVALSL